MSEQNENFVQRQRDAEREYNLQLVDRVAEEVKELWDRLTATSQDYREVAESVMDTDSRQLLRDISDRVWQLSWDIDTKLEKQRRDR